MNKNNFCVIMAGGIGSRFWPISRTKKPKQFLDILNVGKTLLQQTFERFKPIIPVENFLIVTNEIYKGLVSEQLPELSNEQILLEPFRRNTAPCIAYANHKIKKLNPKANIIVAPSDHLITNEHEFLNIIKKGLDFISQKNALLTLGMKPTRPETGYGYIQITTDNTLCAIDKLHQVKSFTEKPNLKLANFFVNSGEFYWNSGIFLWSLESIDKAFNEHLIDVNELFSESQNYLNTNKEEDYIEKVYTECKNISIDYGIMEKAKNVFVLCADFGWSDLGTWGSLYENSEKNELNNVINQDDIFTYDIEDSIIHLPKGKIAVLQGLKNYIVAESDGVLLVCQKEKEQKIKDFVNKVIEKKGKKMS